jgi:hypothetical protein
MLVKISDVRGSMVVNIDRSEPLISAVLGMSVTGLLIGYLPCLRHLATDNLREPQASHQGDQK